MAWIPPYKDVIGSVNDAGIKRTNETLNRPSGSETPKDGHPADYTLKDIDRFAFSLDHAIKAHPDIPELRTAQRLLLHLTGKIYLTREALK